MKSVLKSDSKTRHSFSYAVVAVEAPTPAKKKALPAFALDFGNGA